MVVLREGRTPSSRISAILFDLDNTLIETRKADSITCHKVSETMTREYDIPSSVAKKAADTFLRRFRRCPENPRMPLDEYRLCLWIEALGEDYEDLAEDIYMRWRKLRYRNLAVPETTLNLLKNLHKQYQLAIVTNGPSQSQWEKIRELRLEEYFDCIVVSGDLKWEKPQPEIFHRVCTALGVQPYECLMVGDKIETDIVGGCQAQLGITVWIPLDEPGQETPNPPPDFVICDIHQLVGILQGGNDKTKTKGLQRSKGKNSSAPNIGSSSSGCSSASASSSSSGSSSTPSSSVAKTASSSAVVSSGSTNPATVVQSSAVVAPTSAPSPATPATPPTAEENN